MKKLLKAASIKAEAELQAELKNKLAHEVIHEEAEDFSVYVEALTSRDLAQVEPLPYRHVVSKPESERLWDGSKVHGALGVTIGFLPRREQCHQTFLRFTLIILKASAASTSSGMV